jgi:hypothetical protein
VVQDQKVAVYEFTVEWDYAPKRREKKRVKAE